MGTTVNTLLVNVNGEAMAFQDVTTDQWFAVYVKDAAEAGIVSGYKDAQGNPTGRFGPADNVTFAQAMKIAIEAAGYSVNSYSADADYQSHWAAKYMEIGKEMHFDVLAGGKTNIDRPATRAEVAAIARAAFGVKAGSMSDASYTDVTASTPYANAIFGLARDGVVSGDKDASGNPLHRYRPGSPVNRAETTKIAMEARVAYGMTGHRETSSSSAMTSSSVSSAMSSSVMTSSSASALSSSVISSISSSALSSSAMSSSSSSAMSSSAAMSSSSSVAQTQTVEVTFNGTTFSPSTVTIKVGDTVKFTNTSTVSMWVASNSHPSHTDYPGFDEGTAAVSGGGYSFKFTKTGTWSYHNHVSPNQGGQVIVQ